MKLRVEYMAQLRAAAGCTHHEVELTLGNTLADLLAHLAASLAEARSHFLTSSGQIQPSLLVVVNGAAVGARDGVTLKDGDVVTLLPPIAGG